jgi:hypothetical protein
MQLRMEKYKTFPRFFNKCPVSFRHQFKMGNLITTPKDEAVVLVPPRFSVRGLTRSIEIENPMSLYFGNLFRREVLLDLHSFKGAVGLDVLIAPENPPATAAHVSLSGSVPARTVGAGSLHLHLNNSFANFWHALGRLSLGTTEGLTGFGMVSHMSNDVKLSVTGSVENSEPRTLGMRLESPDFLLGAEVPVPHPEKVSVWGITRVLNDFCVGIIAHPLQSNCEPLVISGSLEKRIPGTDSTYCVSSTVNIPTKELTIGFSQHLVTHRKVYNIFEDKRVKFIANYVDIAVEANSKPNSTTNVAAGLSWQPNKNMLMKLHASTQEGLISTLAIRNYWVPSVLVALSAGVDLKGNPFLGGRLQVSNWLSSAEYQRGQPISTLPVTKWIVTDEVDRFSNTNKFE